MKTSRIIQSLSLLMYMIFMISMFSCQQDSFKSPDNDFNQSMSVHAEFIRNYLAANSNEGIVNRTPTRDINETLELLNHGLNSIYCRPGQDDYELTQMHYDTIIIPMHSAMISEDDIEEAMDSISTWAGSIFYGRSENHKVSWIFDHRLIGYDTNGDAEVQVLYMLREGHDENYGVSFPYDDPYGFYYHIDEIIPGEFFLPDVNCPETMNVTFGAEDLYRAGLRKELEYRKAKNEPAFYYADLYVACFRDCNVIEAPWPEAWDEIVSVSDFANTNDSNPGDNFFEYKIWTSFPNLPNFHTCMTKDEMNFHYTACRSLFAEFAPSDRDLLSNIEVGFLPVTNGLSNVNQHSLQGHWVNKYPASVSNARPLPVGN